MMTAKKIAKLLLDIKAVTVRTNPPFTWAWGLKAPIYCDHRLIISFPQERREIINGFKETIIQNKLKFDVIGGTAMAAIPWASFLAYELNMPMVYIRPQPKDHGKGKQVEGAMKSGSRVLIVEDLISTGGSSLNSAAACEKECQADVIGVLAIFNYQMEQAKKNFNEKRLPLYTLSNFATLIEVASQEKYLSPQEKEQALLWSQNPENWWDTISKQSN